MIPSRSHLGLKATKNAARGRELTVLLAALIIASISTKATFGQTCDPTSGDCSGCCEDNGGADCMADLVDFNLNCTANDVRVSMLEVVGTPPTCRPNDVIMVPLRARLVAGAHERYDIGIFIANDGGDARTGDCCQAMLPGPLSSPASYDPSSGCGPYLDLEDDPGSRDECGDIEQGVDTFIEFTAVVACEDADGDGLVDVGTCVSWDNTSDSECFSLAETLPGTPSKCRCERVPVACLCIDDGNECTEDVCTGDVCIHPPKANGSACGDPSNSECNNPDTCVAGVCQPNNASAGTPCSGDGNECTDDVCDGSGICTHPGKPNGTTCGNPADTECDNPDTCLGGLCQSNNAPAGTACTDDGDQCTDDICNSFGVCAHPPSANGTPCDDNNICTTDPSSCIAGACVGGPSVDCDDGDECTEDSCNPARGCQNAPIPGCPVGGEGCTPGYWKQHQHFDSWADPYDPEDQFSDYFEDAFPGKTLLDVLKQGGNGVNSLGRHVVAALLNAGSPGVSYGLSVSQVIQMFNDVFPGGVTEYNALKASLAGLNEQGCPLN